MRPLAITTLCTLVLFLHGGFLKAGEERSVIDEIPELAQALKIKKGETLFVRGETRRRDLIQGALRSPDGGDWTPALHYFRAGVCLNYRFLSEARFVRILPIPRPRREDPPH